MPRPAEWAEAEIRELRGAKAALQAENLAQPIDIAACQRQLAELQRRRPVALLAFGVGRRRTLGVQRNAEWHDERSEQDRIGQRVWSRLEFPSVRVERGERPPQLLARAPMQLD